MSKISGFSLFAKLMQSFGMVMIVLSLWLLWQHPLQKAEQIISIFNLVIGGVLITSGWFLSIKERKNKVRNSIIGG